MNTHQIYHRVGKILENFRLRLGIVGAVVAVFVVLFPAVYRDVGPSSGVLITVVVLISSILLGIKGGIVFWALSLPYYIAEVSLAGRNGFAETLDNWPGIVGTLLIAFAVGGMKNVISSMWQHSEANVELNEDRLRKINACFLSFGADPVMNIKQLTLLAGELLGAQGATYVRNENGRFDGFGFMGGKDTGMAGGFSDGALIHLARTQESDDVVIIRNLHQDPYGDAVARIFAYRFATFAGQSVKIGHDCVGSLGVLFESDAEIGRPEREMLGIVSSAISVEEKRRRVEEEMNEGKELFQLISNLTTDYIFISKVTPDGKTELDLAIGSLKKITGYTPEEFRVIGHWRTIVHPDDLDKDTRDFQKLLRNEDVISDIRIIHKKGHVVWMRIYAHPMWDGKTNTLTGISGAAQDITDRVIIEQTLRQKERYQRALLDNFPFAVWLKDTGSRFLSVNAGFVRTFGAESPDELIGKTDFDIAPPEMAEGYRVDDREVMESREKKNVEELILTDGAKKWFETYKAPVIDENGELLGTVGFARDVTERKQADEEIRDALAEKTVLLKEVHHRVKNNLQIVSSMLNLQAGEIDNPKLRQLFTESINRVRSMALVHEKMYQTNNLSKIDFGEYVRSMTVQLIRSYDRGDVSCRVDAGGVVLKIEQALPCGLIINEMVTNSLKHAFPAMDGGEIRITMHNLPYTTIEFTVEDNGVGFPEGKNYREMTSMGMGIIMSLTEQLGGTIELDRSIGTRFRVTFAP